MPFQPGNALARTHGLSNTREYKAWGQMIQRCTNPNNPDYHYYGERGIQVCRRWRKFENFLADMGPCPPGLTLDRKNNDKNYSPSNCRWATRKTQMRNTRNTNLITHAGVTLCVSDWARRENVSRNAITQRVAVNGSPVRH